MGSTVEQDRSHLAQQFGYFGERGSPRAVLDKPAGMMGYTFADEETQKIQEHTSVYRNYWDQKLAAIERLLVSTMERTNRWRMMFAASWTKLLISRQPF